jgi:anti-sigma B factor antagonist
MLCETYILTASICAVAKVVRMGLEISSQQASDVTILYLRGRATIGGGESELLSSHLRKLLASGVRKLVMDLKELIQVDSSGIGIIVGTCVSLRRQGGDLKLLCPRDKVLNVLTVFRLLDVIESFEDEAQAIASFRAGDYTRLIRC